MYGMKVIIYENFQEEIQPLLVTHASQSHSVIHKSDVS